MDSSTIIYAFVLTLMVKTNGQVNRYINPVWLEMDANSEYYPGGEVISQILQSYGLGDNGYGQSRYKSSVLHRNSYGRTYPRNQIVNTLNNAYDSDPLTQAYLDRNYDYADHTIRGLNRYQNNVLDMPVRRNRINMVPRTTYDSSEYEDRDLPSVPYSRSRLGNGDTAMSQALLVSRGREATRLVPRSTVTPDANEKRKI